MQTPLKLYHKLLPIIFVPICLFVSTVTGYSAYSTITQRNGSWGTIYMRYGMTELQYTAFNGVMSITGFGIIFFTILYLYQKNARKMNWTFWGFLLYIVFIILCNLYLQSRWIGKG